ncbi:PIN domain-containing protein [Nostoc sp. ChiVER01]|uniref:PIN domain-containing protein n=1 Tax=Nostoc sp. ChiVER01 TaxID=3075382 RepID=UPI002AD500F0|nr:PIN domain-containing protein [Nostoc sp. ChiVER01]MDZ8223852.1 PIN domain-containing protein [Nostoc sp. ChiVER01]
MEFTSHILPLTDDILDNWAKFSTNAELKGKKLAVMDSLIAATAHHHKLTLVTRNVDDFKLTPVKIMNPYSLV